jgi:hypothetical protein
MQILLRSTFRWTALAALALSAACTLPRPAVAQDHPDVVGTYVGSYTAADNSAGTLEFRIRKQTGASVRGTLQIDEGRALRVVGQFLSNGTLRLIATGRRRPNIRFNATVSEDGSTMSGPYSVRQRGRKVDEGTFSVTRDPNAT